MTGAGPVRDLMGRLPEPGLEATLAAIRLGLIDVGVLSELLTGWPLLVLDDIEPAAGPRPLLLRADTGVVLVAAFTSPDRIGAHADPLRRPRWLSGGAIAQGAKPGVGIAINPGSEPAIAVGPDAVEQLRRAQPSVARRTPGSRVLTALEHAIVEANAGLIGAESLARTATDAQVVLLSTSDPGSSGLAPAFGVGPAGRHLLAWTDPGLVRSTARGWAVTVVVGDLPQLLGEAPAVLLNPGTGLERALTANALERGAARSKPPTDR